MFLLSVCYVVRAVKTCETRSLGTVRNGREYETNLFLESVLSPLKMIIRYPQKRILSRRYDCNMSAVEFDNLCEMSANIFSLCPSYFALLIYYLNITLNFENRAVRVIKSDAEISK